MADSRVAFPGAAQIGIDTLHRIAQADRQHRLARVFEKVDHPTRRVLKEDMPPVGQQVILRSGANRFDQPLAEFALQKADDATNFLQRESTLTQLADDCNLGQVIERIDALMAVAIRNHNAALVPPLELAEADARELRYPARCEGRRQCIKDSETYFSENV